MTLEYKYPAPVSGRAHGERQSPQFKQRVTAKVVRISIDPTTKPYNYHVTELKNEIYKWQQNLSA